MRSRSPNGSVRQYPFTKSWWPIWTCALLILCSIGLATRYQNYLGALTSSQTQILEIELGEHPTETYVERRVAIENRSRVVRVVRNVEKTCACLRHHFSQTTIAPGASVELLAGYLTPQQRGAFHQTLTIMYFGTTDTTTLRFRGTVGDWVELRDERIDFGLVHDGDRVERLFAARARNSWPKDERALSLSFVGGRIEELRRPFDESRVDCKVTFNPRNVTSPEDRQGELTLAWRSKPGRIVRIPVSARVAPLWYAQPDMAFFGVVPAGESRALQLTLISSDGQGDIADRISIRHAFGPKLATEIKPGGDENEAIVCMTLVGTNVQRGDVLRGYVELIDRGDMDTTRLSVALHAVIQ